MPVKLQGKDYNLVSERLVKLREKWPDAIITTEVEMGANHGIVRCVIEVDNRLATGHALFSVGPDKALERAETTAVSDIMRRLAIPEQATGLGRIPDQEQGQPGKAETRHQCKYDKRLLPAEDQYQAGEKGRRQGKAKGNKDGAGAGHEAAATFKPE